MKKVIYIFFILIGFSGYAQGDSEIFNVVDQAPIPPGGVESFGKYLAKNTNYPTDALKYHLSGDSQIKFVVNEDGTTSLFKIVAGVPGCPACDKEAINVVRFCPQKWTPGKIAGKAVKSWYELPVRFDVR